jgi:hypothetical protein
VHKVDHPQRGTTMLNSKEFCDGINSIINSLNHTSQAESLMASKQMSELLSSHQSCRTSALSPLRATDLVVVPINDINGTSSTGHLEDEQLTRCKLASLYRFFDLFRCSQGIYNHITVSGSSSIRFYYYSI